MKLGAGFPVGRQLMNILHITIENNNIMIDNNNIMIDNKANG